MDYLEARDQGLWNFIQAHRVPWLDHFLWIAGFLGHPLFVLVFSLCTAVFLCSRRRWPAACQVALVLAGGYVLLMLVRNTVGRERPSVFRNPLEESAPTPSFPSERTFLATILFLTLAHLFGSGLGKKPRRRWMVTAGALAFLVGVSRMYVGVCYPTDVLAGWLGGLAWVLFCQAVVEKWTKPVSPAKN
jgi:undecaprenyl-diphosphatase